MTAQTATARQPTRTTAIVKPTESESLLDRMQEVYESIERRAYDIFHSNGQLIGRDVADWLQAESELFHPLHLEIAETDHALNVRAEVPGFTAKELDIYVEGNRLTIAGKHESKEDSKKGHTIYSERCAQELFRSVALPSEVDGTNANATLKDGILTLELPKASRGKGIHVEPKSTT